MPKKTQKTKECERDISRTLAYSSVFNYPMSKFQLYNFLISDRTYNPKFFNTNLERLVKNKIINETENKFYLYKSKTINWDQRYKISKNKITKHTKIFKMLNKIPWIELVAVTGSVSNYNASQNTDIDLFIITKRNRVWVSRLFVVVILKIFNKYRKGTKNDFCANLYVDCSDMLWSKEERNIYIAHSIVTMQPIINKNDCYVKYLNKNYWIFDYFKHFSITVNKHKSKIKTKHTRNHLFDLIESAFMATQKLYMSSKITSEKATKKFIHFNKNDHSFETLKKYKKVLSNRKIS